jgi:dolichol-phosphate mannosyltransferase
MMLKRLKPVFSTRFLKFCAVGASGVLVNLGCLGLFARAIGVQANLAAAMAIEISIITNFLINEAWTFRDRRAEGAFRRRLLRFHLVSLVGAALQWLVFVTLNAAIAAAFGGPAASADAGWLQRWVVGPVLDPADVGDWVYVSQLAGIAIATFWNFFANFYWTWKHGPRERIDG